MFGWWYFGGILNSFKTVSKHYSIGACHIQTTIFCTERGIAKLHNTRVGYWTHITDYSYLVRVETLGSLVEAFHEFYWIPNLWSIWESLEITVTSGKKGLLWETRPVTKKLLWKAIAKYSEAPRQASYCFGESYFWIYTPCRPKGDASSSLRASLFLLHGGKPGLAACFGMRFFGKEYGHPIQDDFFFKKKNCHQVTADL